MMVTHEKLAVKLLVWVLFFSFNLFFVRVFHHQNNVWFFSVFIYAVTRPLREGIN